MDIVQIEAHLLTPKLPITPASRNQVRQSEIKSYMAPYSKNHQLPSPVPGTGQSHHRVGSGPPSVPKGKVVTTACSSH